MHQAPGRTGPGHAEAWGVCAPLSCHHLSDACGSEAKHGKAPNEQLVALGEAEGEGHGGVLAQAQLKLLRGYAITLVADDLALACARDVGLGLHGSTDVSG